VRGLFVTGTGTGVGKSVLSAAICAGLASRGVRVAAFKPVITGLDDDYPDWPPDDQLLARAASAGQAPEEIAPTRFGPPVSPHLAAELAGTGPIDPEGIVTLARAEAERGEVFVCEGVGGLLVPINRDYLVRDLAIALGLPLVIASHPTLGAINHALMTIEAARSHGLTVAGIVLTPWPADPGVIETSNRETIAELAEVRVDVLGEIRQDELATAGAALPIDAWLAG
jgi:dethiobiotin synthetase